MRHHVDQRPAYNTASTRIHWLWNTWEVLLIGLTQRNRWSAKKTRIPFVKGVLTTHTNLKRFHNAAAHSKQLQSVRKTRVCRNSPCFWSVLSSWQRLLTSQSQGHSKPGVLRNKHCSTLQNRTRSIICNPLQWKKWKKTLWTIKTTTTSMWHH